LAEYPTAGFALSIAAHRGRISDASNWHPQFQRTQWFWFLTVLGVCLSILSLGWHVLVFVLGVTVPCCVTWHSLRLSMTVPREKRAAYYRLARTSFWMSAVLGWCVAYNVSIAPLLACASCGGSTEETLDKLGYLYAPLVLTNYIPFGDSVAMWHELYAEAWVLCNTQRSAVTVPDRDGSGGAIDARISSARQ
jgi:hypothetical protein